VRYLFIVQSEGRGHLTQAISLSRILRENGHQVAHTLIGSSKNRVIPSYFFDKIGSEVSLFDTPALITDNRNRKIRVGASVFCNMLKMSTYLQSLKQIHQTVQSIKPDVIVNFCEIMGGLYFFRYRPNIQHICLAHHFLISHPNFRFPLKGKTWHKYMLLLNNKITSFAAQKIIALSFRPEIDLPAKKLFIAPPLLRSEVFDKEPVNGDFTLGYIVYSGYADDVKRCYTNGSNVKSVFFWNKNDVASELVVNEHLTFCTLHDEKFLDLMASCRTYVCSAGFESVCEAAYLQKPVMVIPTEEHYEQMCNAEDAMRTGVAVSCNEFNMNKLQLYAANFSGNLQWFRNWVDSASDRYLELLTNQ
jgi:uncharacterized protein (TIGR00661 family)